jgi:hypothetical protein
MDGKGTYLWAETGNKYEGAFVNGEMTGKGKYTCKSGDLYEGDYINGARQGQGKYIWANGDIYYGEFKED